MQILVRRRFERPVDEHRPANHIFFRDKSPVAAVITHVAIVSHGEIAVGRHYDVVALNVLRQQLLPVGKEAVVVGWRHGRKVVAIVVWTFLAAVDDIWLIELFAIAKYHSIAEMNSISGNSNDSLDHVEPWFR